MLVMFKDTPPQNLIHHLEWHLLLGVHRVLYVDTSCNDDAYYALQPYIDLGYVSYFDKLRCKDVVEFGEQLPLAARGASAIAMAILYAHPELHPPRGSLVIPLDDDEYLRLGTSPKVNAQTLSDTMRMHDINATTIKWLLFGTSGHICQPAGPIIQSFVHRAKVNWAPNSDGSSPLVPRLARGKVIFRFQQDCRLSCATHSCKYVVLNEDNKIRHTDGDECSTINSEKGCVSSHHVTIAHYSVQSQQHWAFKQARGRTSGNQTAKPYVPYSDQDDILEEVHDASMQHLLEGRIVARRTGPMGECLRSLFSNATIDTHGMSTKLPLRGGQERRTRRQEWRNAQLDTTPAVALGAAAALGDFVAHPLSSTRMPQPTKCIPLPLVNPPSEVHPLIFFHMRKSGGSELRDMLANSAEQLGITHFIPCYENHNHSWIGQQFRPYRLRHTQSCHMYSLDLLLGRARSNNSTASNTPAIYAGHFPFHQSENIGAYGWLQKYGVEQTASNDFTCIMLVREPVDRFASCYRERLSRGLNGMSLDNMTEDELSELSTRTDGTHTCVNELVRWVAPVQGRGEEPMSSPGLILTDDELEETKRRMDKCVVANLVGNCSETMEVLIHWFPWLLSASRARNPCNLGSSGTQLHATQSTQEQLKPSLPLQVRRAIAKQNLQDVELYQYAMSRFECLVARARGLSTTCDSLETCRASEEPAATSDAAPGTSRTYGELSSMPLAGPALLPASCKVGRQTSMVRIAVGFYGVARGHTEEVLRGFNANLRQPLQRVSNGSLDIFVHMLLPSFFDNHRTGETQIPTSFNKELLDGLNPCR